MAVVISAEGSSLYRTKISSIVFTPLVFGVIGGGRLFVILYKIKEKLKVHWIWSRWFMLESISSYFTLILSSINNVIIHDLSRDRIVFFFFFFFSINKIKKRWSADNSMMILPPPAWVKDLVAGWVWSMMAGWKPLHSCLSINTQN